MRSATFLLIWYPAVRAQMTCGELKIAYKSACASSCVYGGNGSSVFSASSALTCAHAKTVYKVNNCCLSNKASSKLSTNIQDVWGPFRCETNGDFSNASSWCDPSNLGVMYVPASQRDNLTTVDWTPVLVKYPSDSALSLFRNETWFKGGANGAQTVKMYMLTTPRGTYPFVSINEAPYFQFFCFQVAFSSECNGPQFVCRGVTNQDYGSGGGSSSGVLPTDNMDITYGVTLCHDPDLNTIRGALVVWSDFDGPIDGPTTSLYDGVWVRYLSSNAPKYWLTSPNTYYVTSAPSPPPPSPPLVPPETQISPYSFAFSLSEGGTNQGFTLTIGSGDITSKGSPVFAIVSLITLSLFGDLDPEDPSFFSHYNETNNGHVAFRGFASSGINVSPGIPNQASSLGALPYSATVFPDGKYWGFGSLATSFVQGSPYYLSEPFCIDVTSFSVTLCSLP
jgi:hypothetical protein